MDDYELPETGQSEESGLVNDEAVEIDEMGYDSLPIRILIAVLIILFCWGLIRVEFEEGNWIRRQLHSAINASTSQTFGKLVSSQPVQRLIEEVKGLVRFEEINQRLQDSSSIKEKDHPQLAPLPLLQGD